MRILAALFAAAFLLPAQPPAFETASVKPLEGNFRRSIQVGPASVTARNSLRGLIAWAWHIPRLQFSGPDWLDDVSLEVNARAAAPADTDQLRLMLRTLLCERLGVKVHEEKREMSVYLLVLAKNGPRLHDATDKDRTKLVETTTTGEPVFAGGRGMMTAERVTMADLANQISEPLGKPVLDRTGLKARYDVILDPTAYSEVSDDGNSRRIDPMSMILTAIPQQLGVKVEGGREAVPFWVVDAANKTPLEQ